MQKIHKDAMQAKKSAFKSWLKDVFLSSGQLYNAKTWQAAAEVVNFVRVQSWKKSAQNLKSDYKLPNRYSNKPYFVFTMKIYSILGYFKNVMTSIIKSNSKKKNAIEVFG